MDADVLRRVIDARVEDVWTALPARVDAYDAAAQTVDVTPMVRRPLPTAEGAPTGAVFEDLPKLVGVPLMFQRGGGCSITFPIEAGNHVLLVVATWDVSGWRVDGVVSDPGFLLAHGLHACFAIPGIAPLSDPLPESQAGAPALVIDAPEIRLTKEATHATNDYIALAKKVEDALDDLREGTKDAISGCTGQNPAPLTNLSFNVRSSKVKAK
jgi:hypothetical protein